MTHGTDQLNAARWQPGPDADNQPSAPDSSRRRHGSSRIPRVLRRLPDPLALAALLAAWAAINDVGTWIRAPYWLDESWVALSARVPVAKLPDITAHTPIGWSLLLRLAPGPDRLRVVPMAFAALTVVAGYLLGRLLPWRTRTEAVLAGVTVGAAVVLLPAEQLRHDLKQYTADAAVILALMVGLVWLERAWSRRRLAVLAAGIPLGLLVSQATIVAAAAVFGALGLVCLVRRDWRRLIEAGVAGVAAGVPLIALYLIFIAPHRVPALTAYWHGYFPTTSQLPTYLDNRTRALAPTVGFSHTWQIGVLLLASVATLVVLRQPAAVTALVLIGLAVVVLGVQRMYPLLDDRTSYFLLVMVAAVCGVAVAGSAIGVARLALSRATPPWRHLTAGVVMLAALAGFATAHRAWYDADSRHRTLGIYTPIEVENLRAQVRWTDAHRAPGDVVLLSNRASFGYVYYHDTTSLTWQHATNTIGWLPVIPAGSGVVVAKGISQADIQAGVDEAVRIARANGPRARVIVIRSHWVPEHAAWDSALAPYNVGYPYSGTEPVAVITRP